MRGGTSEPIGKRRHRHRSRRLRCRRKLAVGTASTEARSQTSLVSHLVPPPAFTTNPPPAPPFAVAGEQGHCSIMLPQPDHVRRVSRPAVSPPRSDPPGDHLTRTAGSCSPVCRRSSPLEPHAGIAAGAHARNRARRQGLRDGLGSGPYAGPGGAGVGRDGGLRRPGRQRRRRRLGADRLDTDSRPPLPLRRRG